jgi:hypothetical protein
MKTEVVGFILLDNILYEFLVDRTWRISNETPTDDTFVLEVINHFMQNQLNVGPSDGWPLPVIFNDASDHLQEIYADAKATLLLKFKNEAFPGAVY